MKTFKLFGALCLLASGLVAQQIQVPAGGFGYPSTPGVHDLAGWAVASEVANDSSTGTTLNKLAKITTTGAIITATGDSFSSPAAIVVAGAGTSGNAQEATTGQASCVMDATNGSGVRGQPVVKSVTGLSPNATAGDCYTTPAANLPVGAFIIGKMLDDSTTAGAAAKVFVRPAWFGVQGGSRSVSGSSDTLLNSDQNTIVVYTGSTSTAVAIAQAGSLGFSKGWATHVQNAGTGTVTITATTSNFSCGTSCSGHTLTLAANAGAYIESDGSNYSAVLGGGAGGATIASTPLLLKGDNAGNGVAAGFADIFALFSGCSSTQYPGYDGTCHTASGSPGGSNTQFQFNDSGAFNGAAPWRYTKATTNTNLVSVPQTGSQSPSGLLLLTDHTTTPIAPLEFEFTGQMLDTASTSTYTILKNATVTVQGTPGTSVDYHLDDDTLTVGGSGVGSTMTLTNAYHRLILNPTSTSNAGSWSHNFTTTTRVWVGATANVGASGALGGTAIVAAGYFDASVTSGASGTISNLFGIEISPGGNASASATVTNLVALRAGLPTSSTGTITNSYGILIANGTVPTTGASINCLLCVGTPAAGNYALASVAGDVYFTGGKVTHVGTPSATSGIEVLSRFQLGTNYTTFNANVTQGIGAGVNMQLNSAFTHTYTGFQSLVKENAAQTVAVLDAVEASIAGGASSIITDGREFNGISIPSSSGTYTNLCIFCANTVVSSSTTYTNIPYSFKATDAAAANSFAGSVTGTDLVLTCTMSGGACAAVNLAHTYTAAPFCHATWTGTGALAGTIKVASTTTTVTVSSSNGADTAQVNIACFGY